MQMIQLSMVEDQDDRETQPSEQDQLESARMGDYPRQKKKTTRLSSWQRSGRCFRRSTAVHSTQHQ